jgi:peptidoglycan/xylan/chitin deacetylase (PgdA/CDA1 family)
VLAYHGVGSVPPRQDVPRLFVTPRRLSKHIDLLQRWGYRFVAFSTLLALEAAGTADGCVALTFDDGLEDNWSALAPLLGAHGITATVFVVSGWLGEPHPDAPGKRLMTADEVRRLHASGVEIGGHTATHPDLTTLEYEPALAELRDGRLALEEVLSAPVTVAAYPYGRANEETRRAARDAGFDGACRAWGGHGNRDDPFDYPRQDMGNGSTGLGLRLKRHGRYEKIMSVKAARGVRRLHYYLSR